MRRSVIALVAAWLIAVTSCATGGRATVIDRSAETAASPTVRVAGTKAPATGRHVSRSAPSATGTGGSVTSTTAPASPDLEIRQGILTTENWQTYEYRTGPDRVTIEAPEELNDSNVREVFWPADAEPVRDGEMCTTWDSSFDMSDLEPLQPGLAMRNASTGPSNQGLRAVTVTQNVWRYGIWLFNVHVWDTLEKRPMTLLRTWDLSEVVAPGSDRTRSGERRFISPPWHLCGRTAGDEFRFKVWADHDPEPSWDDTDRVFSTTLPDGWDQPGYSGGYIGHMHQGQRVTAVFAP